MLKLKQKVKYILKFKAAMFKRKTDTFGAAINWSSVFLLNRQDFLKYQSIFKVAPKTQNTFAEEFLKFIKAISVIKDYIKKYMRQSPVTS